jgi:multidrug efflux pump subunit AcrA (membrane-fusion protein)
MRERPAQPWPSYVLGVLCVGAIVAAVLVVGPASGSQSSALRTAAAAVGVVQATVSGSGNLQPASQLNLGFKTSGVVTKINVTQGEHVTEGRLLAELDPKSAEVTLEQAKASLQAAEASLAQEEEDNGETAVGQGSTGTSVSRAAAVGDSSAAAGSGESSNAAAAKPTVSAATREANIASARAAVRSDKLTVENDEQAVSDTRLYAPRDGTIVSLSGEVGETVSGVGTTKAAATTDSSSGSGSGSASGGASSALGGRSSGSSSASAASSASNSSGSSSSSFAVLSDLSSMRLVVPLSESEIGDVRDGQIATVTVEALAGRKLAAHVSEVAILSTSDSGVVSYDVTFALDQMEAGLKPGMSATAEVVVNQAEGVNVPTSAISAGTVTVVRNGRQVRQRVVTGLAGNSSTIVLSGLKAGEEVVLPSATTSATGASLTGRRGALGGLGGGLGGGFAGGAFFRGGG